MTAVKVMWKKKKKTVGVKCIEQKWAEVFMMVMSWWEARDDVSMPSSSFGLVGSGFCGY